jgi:hypothetical protein
MTNFMKNTMIAAATVVVAAGTASAQTFKAEIPFTFRAGGKVMPAGTYQLKRLQGLGARTMFRFDSADGLNAVLLVPQASGDPAKAWAQAGKPVLSFECGVSRCALARLWTGSAAPAFVLSRPKLGRDEPVRAAVIIMRPEMSE